MANDDLNKVVMQLQKLAGLPKLTARRCEKKFEGLVVQQFWDGVDPYGRRWAPLAESTRKRGRTPPPLTDNGDMLESLSIRVQGTSVELSMDTPFEYHQAGTGKMPARPIFPYEGLPESWVDAIEESVDEELAVYDLFSSVA